MEDSSIMTDYELTEIQEETPTEEITTIQELITEITTTELLTSTETTSTVTTTICPTYANLEKIDVDMLNNFTYIGTFFIIFCILLIVFRGLNRLFRIFI